MYQSPPELTIRSLYGYRKLFIGNWLRRVHRDQSAVEVGDTQHYTSTLLHSAQHHDCRCHHRKRATLMQFTLIDRIVELQPGVRIQTVKSLSPAEEYLKDHFPGFPVMPGVLMLEAMYQSGAWLIRHTEDFAHSMVILKEARNVKYADFVAPGRQLVIDAEVVKQDDSTTTMKTVGRLEGKVAVQARLTLERFNLADKNREHKPRDLRICHKLKEQFDLLLQPA